MQWIVRHDDDVYMRPLVVLSQLTARPAFAYFWGNFDHGSNPVRDPTHQHFNTYEQMPERKHPMWGDVFPPYARGNLWAMSVDLLSAVVEQWMIERAINPKGKLDEKVARQLPHPDDPALGVVVSNLVQDGLSVNLDDRDFNSFSLNPSCTSKFSNIHNRTWLIHHVGVETMHCMWKLDAVVYEDLQEKGGLPRKTIPSTFEFPDLCACSTDVQEEEDPYEAEDGTPFWYPKHRFNSA